MTEAAIDKLKLEADDSLPLRDVVFHTLRDAILEGTLPPGTRLMELQLSSVLGVSRTPVREAMRLLSMEGLVRMSVRRGTIVEPIKESDLRDALEVREALEELAVRKACRNMDELTIQTLKKLEQEFELSLEKNDMQTSARLDVQFHERITETAHNRRLTQSLTQLREELYRYRLENLKDPKTYPILVQAHRNIISALEAHDEDRAAQELQKHIESQADVLAEHIQ
jgi:DNA-binding GntR family transcriptional regulator